MRQIDSYGEIRLEVPRDTPTNNELLRMHWRDQRRLTKTWAQEIMVAKCEQLPYIPAPAVGWRHVWILSYRWKLIMDDDNLMGGCKPVLDALTQNGLIEDDRRELVKFKAFQQVDRKNPRTVIIIGGSAPEETTLTEID